MSNKLKDRLLHFIRHAELTKSEFEQNCGFSNGFVDKAGNNTRRGNLDKISIAYPELNINWLLTGEGSMLKSGTDSSSVKFYDSENAPSGKRLIPLYDDVSTIGGNLPTGYTAQMPPDSQASEWIDPGDWFKSATHAIRHYEDSMVEYPSGCILAMKEVKERQLIIWGREYVIETNEYRITKRVQRGKTEDYIKAYSSNTDVYPDGQLVHEPQDIAWKDIRRIFLVLGYVVKKGDGTIVYSSQNQ